MIDCSLNFSPPCAQSIYSHTILRKLCSSSALFIWLTNKMSNFIKQSFVLFLHILSRRSSMLPWMNQTEHRQHQLLFIDYYQYFIMVSDNSMKIDIKCKCNPTNGVLATENHFKFFLKLESMCGFSEFLSACVFELLLL